MAVVFLVSSIVILLVVTFFLLYYLHNRNWPMYFDIEVSKSTCLSVYINGFIAYELCGLRENCKTRFIIGSNITNKITGKPLMRDHLKSVVLFLGQPDTTLTFSPGNLPKDKIITLSKDLPGFSIIPTDEDWLKEGKWNKCGFYNINLPDGVKLL